MSQNTFIPVNISAYIMAKEERSRLTYSYNPNGESGYIVDGQVVALQPLILEKVSTCKGNHSDNPSKYIF